MILAGPSSGCSARCSSSSLRASSRRPWTRNSAACSDGSGSPSPVGNLVMVVRPADRSPPGVESRFPGSSGPGHARATSSRPLRVSRVTMAGAFVGICRTVPSKLQVPLVTPCRSSVFQSDSPVFRLTAAAERLPISTTRSSDTPAMAWKVPRGRVQSCRPSVRFRQNIWSASRGVIRTRSFAIRGRKSIQRF